MNISKQESLALRGLAITIIVLHNIVHLAQKIMCNESYYSQEFTDNMWNNIYSMPYSYIISFWGWLGVPLFVFLSGYGLQKKCELMGGGNMDALAFVKSGLRKLFLLMAPAYVFFFISQIVIESCSQSGLSLGGFAYLLIKGISQLTFTSNLLYPYSINPGVFWYFGLTAQLYIIFAFLLRRLSNRSLIIVAVSTFLLLTIIEIIGMDDMKICFIRKQCLGWLSCFILGIIAGRKEFELSSKSVITFFVLVALLFFTSVRSFSWVLPELIALTLFIMYRKSRFVNNKFWIYIGSISASLFAVHPVLRYLWFQLPISYDNQVIVFVVSFVFLSLSITLSFFYDRLYKKMLLKFNSDKKNSCLCNLLNRQRSLVRNGGR